MDANGTHFHLLLGREDWANCLDSRLLPLWQSWEVSTGGVVVNNSGIDWDETHAEVTLKQRLFQFIARPSNQRPSLADRRGAARDGYGNWYWIDESRREILINSSGTQATTHFWASSDQVECKPSEDATGDFRSQQI